MMIEPIIIQFFLSLLGTGVLTGLAFILRSLNAQNKALAILVQRVGTLNHEVVDRRLLELEGDMVRVWAWKDAQDARINA